jgi:hypothetical protein
MPWIAAAGVGAQQHFMRCGRLVVPPYENSELNLVYTVGIYTKINI